MWDRALTRVPTRANDSKYDDDLGGTEFPEGPPSNNDLLPPSNQTSHSASVPPSATSATAATATPKDAGPHVNSHTVPNHRKNSIEMFLSQSPSQSLGGDFLKLSLDDRSLSGRANDASAFASGHFTLNPVTESPKKFVRTASLRLQPSSSQPETGRFAGDVPPPLMSRSSSASSYSNYQLSPRAGSEDSWHGSQDGGQQPQAPPSVAGGYYPEQEYYNGGAPYSREPEPHPYYLRPPPHDPGMYRNQHAYSGGTGYGGNGRTNTLPPSGNGQWNPNFVASSSGYNHTSANSMYHMHAMHASAPPPHYQPHSGMRTNSGGRGNRHPHPHASHGYVRMTPPLPEASPPHSPRKAMLGLGMAKQCKFFLQGHCRMGSKCKFAHQPVANQHMGQAPPQYNAQLQMSPLHRQGSDDMAHPFARHQSRSSGHYRQPDYSSGLAGPQPSSGLGASGMLATDDAVGQGAALRVEDIQGRVFVMSKDQNGCRLLQEQLDYDDRVDLSDVIYHESLDHLAEMMVDPFGNYLFQKLLERVSATKRLAIIRRVSSNLVAAALNLHGTRSVQKVVEVCAMSAEVVDDDDDDDDDTDSERGPATVGRRTVNLPDIIVDALKDDAVRLCIDSNGNHVIQRALQYMKPEYNQFVFDAVCQECTTVGTHRHGCCVLQRCLDAANKQQKAEVIAQVEKQAMKLMQDPYGNYVVQYVLDSCTADEAYGVMAKPLGSIFELSVQKFSSNVIEKCLEKAPERVRQNYVKEIISCPKMNKMLQDQFANYVVQRALCVCSEEQCLQLVKAIRPHLACMKNTSGGRRITARILKRFPTMDISADMGLSPTHDGMYEPNGSHLSLGRLPPAAVSYGSHQHHQGVLSNGGYPPHMHGHGMPMHSNGGYASHHHHPPHNQHSGGLMSDVVGSGLGVNAAGTSRA